MHFAFCILHFAFCILHFAFCILHFAFCILHFAFCILHFAFCILHFAFCILHFAFCILHFAFCILHFAFCILHFAFCICICICIITFAFTFTSVTILLMCVAIVLEFDVCARFEVHGELDVEMYLRDHFWCVNCDQTRLNRNLLSERHWSDGSSHHGTGNNRIEIKVDGHEGYCSREEDERHIKKDGQHQRMDVAMQDSRCRQDTPLSLASLSSRPTASRGPADSASTTTAAASSKGMDRPDEMEGPIISFTGFFPPNSDKFEIKTYVEDTVLPMLSQKHREEIDFEPIGPGRFRSWQHMWSIINTLKAKGLELEGRCIKVSPKLDRRGAQKKVQCTRAMKAAETLLPGAEPKSDFEYGKVWNTTVRSSCGASETLGRHWVWISHRSTSTRLWRGATMSTGQREKCVFSHPGITFVTWNTCGSADIDVALPGKESQVSS